MRGKEDGGKWEVSVLGWSETVYRGEGWVVEISTSVVFGKKRDTDET
jgi:hypothetical protein